MKFGICEASIMHTDPDQFDLETRFQMVAASDAFDYFDKTPALDLEHEYAALSEKI